MADAQRYFEDAQVGDTMPVREFGPLTIMNAVQSCYRGVATAQPRKADEQP